LKIIGQANLIDSLYHMWKITSRLKLVSNVFNYKTQYIDIWHFKFGHPSNKDILSNKDIEQIYKDNSKVY